jgi:hypothetical protein
MRRPIVARLVAGAILATLLVPSAVLAAPAAGGASGASASPSLTASPAIRLGCALVIPVPRTVHPAIVCRWSAPEGVSVRAYRLWRVVDARPRQLIATVAAGDPRRHADRNIAAGHAYTYRVVALGADGSRVAVSNRVTVRVGRLPQQLRFDCAFMVDGAVRGVACRWSATTRPAAVRYVLFRSVDGAAREAIYRTGLDGRRRFLDTDVAAGQKIRYAVVALSATGRVVAVGGPDAVLIPALVTAADAR